MRRAKTTLRCAILGPKSAQILSPPAKHGSTHCRTGPKLLRQKTPLQRLRVRSHDCIFLRYLFYSCFILYLCYRFWTCVKIKKTKWLRLIIGWILDPVNYYRICCAVSCRVLFSYRFPCYILTFTLCNRNFCTLGVLKRNNAISAEWLCCLQRLLSDSVCTFLRLLLRRRSLTAEDRDIVQIRLPQFSSTSLCLRLGGVWHSPILPDFELPGHTIGSKFVLLYP